MYDVIVVGSRCAGSPTAMLLARQGHRVLLIDKARFPSDTLSTHLLKPRAMAYLDRWGLRERLAGTGTAFRHEFAFTREGITLRGAPSALALRRCLERSHGPELVPSSPVVEWASIRRRVLDHVLLEAAMEAGVEFRDRFVLEELVFDRGGRVVGIRGRTRDGRFEERARVVVGADGRHSRVAKQLAAGVLDERSDCTYTVYSYYSGLNADGFLPPVHLRGRLGIGFGPTNDGLVLVSAWGPKSWFPAFRSDLETNLLRMVEFCYAPLAEAIRAEGRREAPIRGTVDLTNVLRRGHGPGWVLVGDAGCHVDQCTAIGITHAFRDAQLAADNIHRALAGAEATDDALARFDRQRLEELRPSFEYVSDVARCSTPRIEQLRVVAALGKERKHIERFMGYGAMIVPPADYFSPQDLAQMVDDARPMLDQMPALRDFADRTGTYEVNPWT